MTFITGLIIFLNYNMINLIMDGNVLEGLALFAPIILLLLALRVMTIDCKSYKIKNKLSIKFSVIIEMIGVFIIFLIGEIIAASVMDNLFNYTNVRGNLLIDLIIALLGFAFLVVSVLGIPIKLVSLASDRTHHKMRKEERRIIDRDNKIKAKQQEEQKAIENEYKEKLDRLYRGTNSIIYDMVRNKIDDKNLNLNLSSSKEKWLNNDEKLNYYEELFEKLNSKLNGNYEEYLEHLMKKEKSISDSLEDLALTFTCLRELSNTNKNKIKSFNEYIQTRQRSINLDYKGCKAGIQGENKVNKELSLYNNIINLPNIRLEVSDSNNEIQSIENDNILLTKNGIFVLEVKNFGEIGSYDIVIEKDGRWLRKNRYDGKTTVLKNVTSQNNRHIAFLNKFINEGINRSFDDYIEAEGVVVIANEKVSIENYNDNQNIFRDSEIYSYIKSQEVKFKRDELEQIRDLILSKNLPPKKYPVFDYSMEIIENIKILEAYLNDYEKLVNRLEIEYRKYIDRVSEVKSIYLGDRCL